MRKLLLFPLLLCLVLFSRCSTESTPVFNLAVSSAPSEGGTVSPAQGEYDEGTIVEVTASANEGWVFQGWQGDHTGSENPASILMNSDKEIAAQFQQRTYPLTIHIEGEGNVVEEMIQDKTSDFEEGTVVQLTAEPSNGWRFVEWQGDLSGSENPSQITIDSPKDVTAVFERREYPLTVTMDGEGSVTEQIVQQRTTDYEFGTVVELTANPASGWKFVEWQGDASGSENSVQITVDEAKEVTAVFETKAYDLSVNITGEGGVSEQIVNETGPVVELTANPVEGWEFVGWQGDLSGSENPATVLMDVPKEITAVFEIKTFSLSVDINGQGSVRINPDRSSYDFGSTVELRANAAEDWIFSGWTGDVESSQRSIEITMDSDKKLTAAFEEVDYDLTINTIGEGTVDQEIVQNEGPIVELTASPANGWEFVEWQGDINGSQNPTQLMVDSPKEVTAVFEKQTFDLTINTSGEGSVQLDPDLQEYEFGTAVELTVTAAEGWDFAGWQGDLSGSQNPAQITMDQAKEVTAVFEIQTFELLVNATGNGSVNISPNRSEFDFGSTAELTANPDDGWIFVEWTGDVSSTNNPLSLTIESDTEVTAVFEEVDYDLTINRVGEGSVNQAIVQDEGPVVQLTASPATGWAFVEWQGDLSGSQNPAELTVDTPKEVTAVFERKSFPLTVNITGEGSVSRSPNQQEYEFGTTVDLNATPANGWEFKEWQGDLSGSNNPAEITIDGAKEVTAVFQLETFELTVNKNGEGSVSRSPNQSEYEFNSDVELTANAATGWRFVSWEGDLTTSQNPASVTMDTDKSVTAVFERESYALNTNTSGNGSIVKNPDQDEYKFESEVELTATPDEGYQFAGWTGDVTSSQNPVTIIMNEEKSVTANFEIETYSLSVDTDGQGSVSIDPDKSEYDFGKSVSLKAEAATGWQFVRWEGDLTTSQNPGSVTMDSDKSVTAVFERQRYALNTSTSGNGSITKDPDQNEYEFESEVELTAKPDEGYEFTGWTGDITSSQNPVTVTMDKDKSVTANFEIETYSLSVDEDGQGSVDIDPDKSEYDFGETVTLTANPADEWEFVEWTGDVNSTNNQVEITMNSDKQVTAVFELTTYELNTSITGQGSINRSPKGTEYDSGTEVELTANPSSGWEFVEWQGDLSGSTNPKSITMNSDKTVTAVFSEVQYSVTAEADGNGSVSVSPDKSAYNFGEEVTFEANPNSGHAFMGWSGAFSSTNNPETIEITEDISVTGTFQKVEDALVYTFSEADISGGKISSAGLRITNTLLGEIIIDSFELVDGGGNRITLITDEDIPLQPDESIVYDVGFGEGNEPTEDEFSNYVVKWIVDFEGNSYTKEAIVGYVSSSSKIIDSKTIIRVIMIN